MSDLVLYLGVTACGYILGSRLRSQREKLHWTGKVQTVAITVLVLLMGMRMGSNPEITENLKTIGWSALLMTIFTIVFSVGAIVLVRKLLGIDRYGNLIKGKKKCKKKDADVAVSVTTRTQEESIEKAVNTVDMIEKEEKKTGMNVMTFIILAAVIIGMLIGYFGIRQMFVGNMDAFDSGAGLAIKIGLCILLLFVGIDLGLDGTVIESIRTVGFRILAFPLATVLGTLAGALIAGLLLELTPREALAVSAGFGWYTLAPGIIMDAGYLTASAISFLHNVMREMTAILFIPLVASRIGYIETTCMPGAAAMDVCLPIVEKATKGEIAVYSFVSGVILSVLVPILVPLIVG